MDLSIIIPMYNAEKYISRCLSSLLDQVIQYEHYEIIIINDGSVDNSLEVAENFSQKYSFIRVYSTKNLGSSSARNLGIKLAKGNFIHFMDSDDYITSNSLNTLLNIAKNNNLDILGFKFLRTKSTKLHEPNILSFKEKNIQILNGEEYIARLNYYRDSSCWYLIKRAYLINSKILFYNNRYLQDTIFTASVFIKAKRVKTVAK